MTDPDPVPNEIVGRFAAEYFVLNSISQPRQTRVLRALECLEEFSSKPLIEITDADLRAWIAAMMDGHQASTVAFNLKLVRPFFRWCWQKHLIDADHLMRLDDVRPPRGHSTGLPRPYSRKELAQLWAELDQRFPYTTDLKLRRWRNGTSPWRSVRRHAMRLQLDAIIELALVCGLRRVEIYRLSIDDVHWDNKYIVVHGKRVDQNDRVREVPYPSSTRVAIERWFRMRAQLSPDPGLPLWLSVTGPVANAGMSFYRFQRVLRPVGRWELHRMRHTCATERLRAGMTLEELRDFLGHSNISMTLRYAQLVRDDIHRAAERTDAEFQAAIRAAA